MNERILVAGGPRVGKTTLARQLGVELGCVVRSTDDAIGLGWSEASLAASSWLDADGSWIVEGVAVPRSLRKWLARHPDGKPADVLYWSDAPRVPLTPGQRTMTSGCRTVLLAVLPALLSRGVEIRPFPGQILTPDLSRLLATQPVESPTSR